MTFFTRSIQPLRACASRMWLYVGPSNTTRELAEELAESELRAWVRHVFGEGTMVNLGNSLTLLHQGVPSTRVRIFAMFFDLVILTAESLTQFHI
jgi:hypothetical protein